MPPPKKAAKKAPKKAAKHSHHLQTLVPHAPGHKETHKEGKDLRRAFEHMRRVEILQASLAASSTEEIVVLATMARTQLADGSNKAAADLMRGSEHLCFALLAGTGASSVRLELSDLLEGAIKDQFDELLEKAERHWEEDATRPSGLAVIYKQVLGSATKALKTGAYYQAMEFIRAAEALAHVKLHGPHKLETGSKAYKLAG